MPISRAQPADLPELAELFAGYLDFYQVPRPLPEVRAFLAARLERGDSVLFIARDQAGRALGFVQLYPFFASLHMAPAFLLSDLYVSPTGRRQGLAEQLMNAARGHAARRRGRAVASLPRRRPGLSVAAWGPEGAGWRARGLRIGWR